VVLDVENSMLTQLSPRLKSVVWEQDWIWIFLILKQDRERFVTVGMKGDSPASLVFGRSLLLLYWGGIYSG